MSNTLISEVYRRQVGNMARNAVMALMADKANNDGSGIWASKQTMADEIGASKQTIIATVKALIADGLVLERGQRRCANGYTVEYAIDLAALRALPLVKAHAGDRSENFTGHADSPVKTELTGQIPLPHQSEDLTPPVKLLDPNPPRTLLEPSDTSYPQGAGEGDELDLGLPDDAKAKPEAPEIPSWMPAEPWNGYLEMRARIGKKPTERAIKLMVGKLERWRTAGHDPGDILDTATERNWTGLFEPKEPPNGTHRPEALRRSDQRGPDRRSTLARVIDEGLEFLG